MRAYKLICLTKEGDELRSDEVTAQNKKDATKIAEKVLANSPLNDLHKIEVRPQEKLLRITFETDFCKIKSIYTKGTYNKNKAIKVAKEEQEPNKFKYIDCNVVHESELTDFINIITI